MMKPIYIERPVADHGPLIEYCARLGVSPVDDFHVTQAFSRAPVDWNSPVFQPLTNRLVLSAANRSLMYMKGTILALLVGPNMFLDLRFQQLTFAGASYDFPTYLPHITLSLTATIDVEKAEVYKGLIGLGSEIREDLNI